MTELQKKTAFLVNTLLQRLSPWYRIRFVKIDSINAKVLVDIGSHRVIANMVTGDARIWFSRSEPIITEPEVRFLMHMNSILAGNVRDDAGEMVSP